MADVPAACAAFDERVRAIEAEIEDLSRELSGIDRPPNEPPLSSAQKAALNFQISRLRGDLRFAKRDLDACVRTNTSPPPPTTPQLGAGVEVVQSIQTFDNGIRLVQEKPTVVRVFVTSGITNGFDAGAGPNRWPNVSGELRVTDPATGATTGPITPFNPGGAIVAVPPAELNRDNAAHSLNFRLPPSVLDGTGIEVPSRRIDISARVFVRGHENEGGGWTAEATATVELLSRPEQEITPILIADLPGGLPAPTMAQFIRVLRRGALARYPATFRLNPPVTFSAPWDLTSAWFGWAQMMWVISTTFVVFGVRLGGIRAGLVNFSPAHAVGGMGVPRIIFTSPAFVVSGVGAESLFAHEMGHSHGLNHSVCSGTEPWLHDARLPGRTDATGMHVEDGAVIPRGSGEVMSYCPDERSGGPPTWPSIATYNLVFDNPA
jgi:hypothetical protein